MLYIYMFYIIYISFIIVMRDIFIYVIYIYMFYIIYISFIIVMRDIFCKLGFMDSYYLEIFFVKEFTL